ncbi:MAG TPA: YetF domain-containing protein [Rhodanobacteraceae bacterium]|nr:YetF domain-containing protein [Rhodanobacteraceae bacterium]HJP98486.1 YetF domain-containing protein [Rhodanobacteraceae bacterium]
MQPLHFGHFLSFSMSPLEILIRGTIMYWFLFLLLRFLLRRDTGSAGISGILFVVLLGDAAQNAMIGNGNTVADGAMLIATLAAWNLLLDWLGSRVPLVARLTDPPAILLVRDGSVIGRNMRREHITLAEVESQLRKKGLERLDQVKRMYLENDGGFSVICA